MQFRDHAHDRRHFLRLAAGFSTGALLAGCGGGGGSSDAVPVVSAPVAVVPAPDPAGIATHPLNLPLTLAYLSGQYHAYAARGTGLPTVLTTGVGLAGSTTGARQVSFADPAIAALAADLASDKTAHVTTLRAEMGTAAAAQPAINLSAGATGAFSIAMQRAGIVAPGQAFDPYADDEHFLLGALLIENAVAATYRTLLLAGSATAGNATLTAQLADAIYHGGLIRALLDDRAAANPEIDAMVGKIGAMQAMLDGSNVGDQTLAGGSATSSNLLDAEGRPIPFTRATLQVLSALYVSNAGPGGFLPAGANGVA
ncbi:MULTISPECIES: ferritin-like domain-containing protein [Bacteria]|uniref:ferritin-like domain-containing protein n=1 Tax=Bacteria TaxID=2 RepID=UPI001401FC1D|nr:MULTISPECIES: ferritin-like domain-containing protein [Bacteria]